MKNLPPAGAFARKQYAFIQAVEEVRDGSSISLYKDSKKLELIITKMFEKGHKINPNEVFELAQRIFKGRDIEKTIRVENKAGKMVNKKVKGYLLWELN